MYPKQLLTRRSVFSNVFNIVYSPTDINTVRYTSFRDIGAFPTKQGKSGKFR